MEIFKNCVICDKKFYKRKTCSKKEWIGTRFCSHSCVGKYVRASGKGKTQFIKGAVSVNKGKRYTEEEKSNMPHLFQKGRTKNGTHNLEKWREAGGVVWNKGLYGYQVHGGFVKTRLQSSIRTSQMYLNWRNSVFMRDRYTCMICGAMSSVGTGRIKLHAHHKKAFHKILHDNNIKTFDDSIKCSELRDINNGLTLCKSCHEKTDSYKGDGTA